jgi:hypothetical protein
MKRTIAYWIVTGLVVFAFAAGGLMDVMRTPQMLAAMAHLGYPAYVAVLLGVWKLAGAAAIAAPRLQLLKEWAYAGMFFDLSGAAVSHGVSGDPASAVATPLIVLALVVVSWWLRPASRRLVSFAGARNERPVGVPAIA